MVPTVLPRQPVQTTAQGERHDPAATQLHGRWLFLARIVWFALVAFMLSICIASLPEYVRKLQTVCRLAACASEQLSPDTAATLEHFGLSVSSYALFMLALTALLALVCCTASGLIYWRKSDDWIALLFALQLVGFGSIPTLWTVASSPSSHLAWALPMQVVWELILLLNFSGYILFPDGRFVPGWTRWLFLAFSIGSGVYIFLTNPFFGLFTVPLWLEVAVVLLFLSPLVGLVIAQIYRYRYVSTPVQQQQTKWVLYGISANTLWFAAGYLPLLIFPRSLFALIFTLVLYGNLFLEPFTMSFAIFRYRLWEIDVLIKRTLVYGTLTLLLAMVYFGSILAMQQLVRAVPGLGQRAEQNPLVLVLSTLLIVVLFTPLRRRIQSIIDIRFYRSHYDAARTLERFAATLRSEVDLSALRENLVDTVQETMQPASVSLWLRESGKRTLDERTVGSD